MSIPSSNTSRAAWALVVALASLALGGTAWAQSASAHKYDEAVLKEFAEGRSVRTIVRFRSEDARQRAAAIVASRGGRIRHALETLNALTVDIDAATADALSAEEGTLTLSIDATVRSSGGPQMFSSATASGAHAARQRYSARGRGVSIAIIDSGVQPHPDLPAFRIRKFIDFVNGRTTPYDDFGHGTHVAGIIAGDGTRSSRLEDGYEGVAPDAGIVALKVLDSQGAGRTSDVIAALEWVARNHAVYNIRVVNLSLGHPVYESAATDPLVQAAEALVARGIVVVASAGNLGIDPQDNTPGHGGVTSPANGPRIIAVGAVDGNGTDSRSDDAVADYSSRGPTRFDLIVKPDLVAAGHRVVSLSAPGSRLFSSYPGLRVAAGRERVASYMVLSGTSMAAPAVSGAAALILQANPGLTAGAVRALLEFTAQRLEGSDVLTQGAGQLNVLGALRLARLVNTRTEPGSVWLAPGSGLPQEHDVLFGEQVAWAKNIVWGQRVILGDAAYLHFPAWHDTIVWGEAADNIVWGQCRRAPCDNIVWGQDTLQNIVWGQCGTGPCNIVWGQAENIVWGQQSTGANNIVWGQNGEALGYWASNTVWGFWDAQVDWASVNQHNIVWGQDYLQNIVWGQGETQTGRQENIVWGQNLYVLTMGEVQ